MSHAVYMTNKTLLVLQFYVPMDFQICMRY